MSKSKCTCAHRPAWSGTGKGPWNYEHDVDCPYRQIKKQDAEDRELRECARRLSSYYRRESRSKQ